MAYIDSSKEVNHKDPNFQGCDHVSHILDGHDQKHVLEGIFQIG